jgi:hypothetical protein
LGPLFVRAAAACLTIWTSNIAFLLPTVSLPDLASILASPACLTSAI